jgi:anhydro-N-acetylmuramic acid kinase
LSLTNEITQEFLPENFTTKMDSEKDSIVAIGVMSGTSLDGLDISVCRYYKNQGKWKFECIDTRFVEYTAVFRNTIRNLYESSARQMAKFEVDFGRFIGEQVNDFLSNKKLKADLISSHGQTIFHSPAEGYTKQVGSGAVIASITGLPVVSDFRQQDVTLCGQGAPLVPIGDELLFSEYAACLNLGGFANISFRLENKRIAYDICAVNFVLNKLAGKLNREFDAGGKLASQGELLKELLDELEVLDFYTMAWPKSLGQEWLEKEVFTVLDKYSENRVEDLLHTYAHHISNQIASVLKNIGGQSVLVTGGGAKNDFLIELISKSTNKEIIVPEKEIIDFKEAIIFGFLGVLRVRHENNCLTSVTGAMRDSCTGAIYIP